MHVSSPRSALSPVWTFSVKYYAAFSDANRYFILEEEGAVLFCPLVGEFGKET